MILTRALTSLTRTPRLCALAMFISAAVLAAGPAAHAALINYGDFNAPPVTFQQVTESSGTDAVPLYGSPTPFITGLQFTPTSFVSSSTGGAADITDGQLNFGVANAGGVLGFNVFEGGDYTLVGAGTPSTAVFAGAIIRVTVTQVNGANVVPFDLTPSNASIGFSLPLNSGIVQPWNLSTGINISNLMPVGQTATKISVSINNSLISTSQPGTVAFIAKKDFRVVLNPGGNIPEPGTFLLTALGSMIGLVYRRARS